ncbi:MAG: CynX/NimT family MFS transporter, partial [Streptosporangiaceae bacterium]
MRREVERTRWGVVCVAVAAGVVVAFQVGKAPPALPVLRRDLGMSLAVAGWVLAAFSLVAAVTGAASGALTGRIGTRRTLLLGLLLTALASVLGGLAPNGPLLLGSRVAEGAGFLGVVIAAPSLIAEVARADDARLAFGFWGTYMPAGQAIMLLAAPLLLSGLGWRGTWYVNAGILVACAVVAWMVLGVRDPLDAERRTRAEPPRLTGDLRTVIRAPGPRLLAVIFATYGLQFLALVGFLPTIYAARGLGTLASDMLTSAVVAANVVGNLGAGLLLHRGAPRWLLICLASTVMGLAAIGVYSIGAPFIITYVLALAFSAFGGLLPTSVLGGAPVLAPHPRLVPATNGVLVQGSNCGLVIG